VNFNDFVSQRRFSMKLSSFLTAMALLAATAGLSQAAPTIVSSALPTTVDTYGACYVRNISTRPVSLQVAALLNFSPGFITPSWQNCNDVPLGPGRTCAFLINDLPDDVTFSCSATLISGSPRNVRGSVEVRSVYGSRVIHAAEMR
jgi:hypothetical protein